MPSMTCRITLLAAILLASPASWAATCHPPPVPVIDWVGTLTGCSPGTGPCAVGEPINFLAKTESGSYAACDVFDWDFGDGSAHSSQQNPTHTFASQGSFPVFLLITNDTGRFEGSSRTVPVAATVLPGIVSFKATPSVARVGQTVVFSWNTTNTPRGVRIENVHPASIPATLKVSRTESIGTYAFVAAKTMSYTITAFGDAAQITSPAPITVEVVGASRGRAVRH
jgi:hypothetical protein